MSLVANTSFQDGALLGGAVEFALAARESLPQLGGSPLPWERGAARDMAAHRALQRRLRELLNGA